MRRCFRCEAFRFSSVRGSDRRQILDGIEIAVADRVLGVLGGSGSGVTTLAKAMVGRVSEPLHVTGSEVLYRSSDLRNPRVQREVRSKIGFIGTDPANAFDPTLPVGNQIAEKLRAVHPDIGNSEAQAIGTQTTRLADQHRSLGRKPRLSTSRL